MFSSSPAGLDSGFFLAACERAWANGGYAPKAQCSSNGLVIARRFGWYLFLGSMWVPLRNYPTSATRYLG